jgi:thioredoxin-related protein
MRVVVHRWLLLLPVVTAAILTTATVGAAADPITWRKDYSTARTEALERGLPLLIVVGTDNCYYCRKLEAGPFRDPTVIAHLTDNFIPLKVDAHKEPTLARALKVQLYPTLVMAAPDGKIHAFIEGYLDADRLVENLKRTITASTTTEGSARDFEHASRAIAGGDYPRAIGLLKGILKDAADKPIGVKARQLLEEIDRAAASRLVRAKELEHQGFTQEAVDTLADVVRTYAGTPSAADAANLMAGIAVKPENQAKLRQRAARDLLASAREEFRTGRFYNCLELCEQLGTVYADLPEGREGLTLAAEVKNNPERLALACEQMNQRTATMYLALADSWRKKGQQAEAIACLEKVTRLCPNSPQAELAQGQLLQLRANGSAVPTGAIKP